MQFFQQACDLFGECGSGQGAVQHVIRAAAFVCHRHLAFDTPDSFGAGKSIPLFKPSNLGFAISGDDDGDIHSFVDPGLKQERHIVDDDGVRIGFGGFSGEPGLLARDTGVDDAFQPAQPGFVSKHHRAQGLAIEGAIGVEDRLAEGLDDFPPGRLARLDGLASQLVRIDDDGAAAREHGGDGAFPGCDPACQSHQ